MMTVRRLRHEGTADALRGIGGSELRGALQLPRLIGRSPGLAGMARGHGRPVLVLPGRGVDDLSTAPMRAYLRLLGHAPTGWALGVNDGDLSRLVPLVADWVEEVASSAGSPVPLVGQSMGGSIARAVARRRPAAVSRVITLGSPIMGATGGGPTACPVTVIYSKADRIVPPRWALAGVSDDDIVEVQSTHFSMGIDPDVWAVIARRLAADEADADR
ncbi:MAG: hypothetical protein JWO77_454 [Ilumatobacteraceae bacterium]|nr:hypothetical protein [Ilumatobacteraceae bacterium]